MSLQSLLESSKSRLTALLGYANGVTGESDVSIGDAILTLCEGYGSGGGLTFQEFTPTEDVKVLEQTFFSPPESNQFLMCYDSGGYVVAANYVVIIGWYIIKGSTSRFGTSTWTNGGQYGIDNDTKFKSGRTYKYAYIDIGNIN